MSCKHTAFSANVNVARLEDIGCFMAEITVSCTECGIPFQFLKTARGGFRLSEKACAPPRAYLAE